MIEVKPETSNRRCYCCTSPHSIVSIEFTGSGYGNFVSVCKECAFGLVGAILRAYHVTNNEKKENDV